MSIDFEQLAQWRDNQTPLHLYGWAGRWRIIAARDCPASNLECGSFDGPEDCAGIVDLESCDRWRVRQAGVHVHGTLEVA